MSSKKGFTLIELLAVILILGIIALIAIPTISKTINTAQKSAFKTSVVNSFKTLDYALYKKNTNTIPESGIDVSELNLKSNFTGGKFMLVNGKETAYYIRNKSFCAYGPMKNLRITDNCESMDLTDPVVDNTKFIVTNSGNNIKVLLNEGLANDTDSGIDKYVINLYEGDKLVKTQEKKNIGETTFDNLKSLTVYTIELVVYNGAGGTNISHKNIKSGVTDIPNISISNNDSWATSKTVTINYDNTKYNCEYSIDGASTWNAYSEPFTLTSNVTINARLIDKELSTNKGNASNKVVTKIDSTKPSVSLSKNGTVITMSLSDSDSGVSYYCIKTTSGSSGCSWTSITNSKSTTETYTASSSATYYAYAKDEAGNISAEKTITLSSADFCSYSAGKTWTYSYTGGSQSITMPCDANYKLEVWGAQGGTYSSYLGGNGGYSVGTIVLSKTDKLYIYVGSTTSSTSSGYNGGGSGMTSGKGGGGATDMRINSTSLYARVIVAGGGGGAGIAYGGGYGGGTIGGDGYTSSNRSGTGGTQYSGGTTWNSITSHYGSFGTGGSLSNGYSAGGGGGGWYGGGGAYDNDSDSDGRGGGGGSGWIYTSSTYSTWKSNNSTDANQYALTNKYYLTSANTYAGNQTFTSTGGSSETGHAGNGYAKITLMSFN